MHYAPEARLPLVRVLALFLAGTFLEDAAAVFRGVVLALALAVILAFAFAGTGAGRSPG